MSDELHRFEILHALTRQAGALVLDHFGRVSIDFKADDSKLTNRSAASE